MKLKIFVASAVSAGVLAASASANELEDACVAALEAEGRDASGCACLVEAVEGDAALVEEFTSLGEIADADERYEAASDDAKAVMDSCTRTKRRGS